MNRRGTNVAVIILLLLTGPATAQFPVIVTSYEIVIADSKLLQRYKWKYVIVDEGHRLKNFNCKLLRELRQIPVDNKLLLTGDFADRLQFLAGGCQQIQQIWVLTKAIVWLCVCRLVSECTFTECVLLPH